MGIQTKDGGRWAVVDDLGKSVVMSADEAQKRLAAEIAIKETPEERRVREEKEMKKKMQDEAGRRVELESKVLT